MVITLSPEDNLEKCLAAAEPYSEIRLSEGDFHIKAVIRTPGITLRGAGAGRTNIIWDDYAKKKDASGIEYNTFRTWTMAVTADDVRLKDLSVINSSLHPEIRGQEVALSVYGDNFSAENCSFSSTQDTLFLGPLPPDLIVRYDGFLPDELRASRYLRQSFKSCLIEGSVDFIFGCGEARFDNCEIRSVYDVRGIGYAAAPAHSEGQEKGFLFNNCNFTHADGVAPGSIYLARPWRDYGLCEFINCSYGRHISPLGFDKWNDTERDKTARFCEYPSVPGRVSWVRTPVNRYNVHGIQGL